MDEYQVSLLKIVPSQKVERVCLLRFFTFLKNGSMRTCMSGLSLSILHPVGMKERQGAQSIEQRNKEPNKKNT